MIMRPSGWPLARVTVSFNKRLFGHPSTPGLPAPKGEAGVGRDTMSSQLRVLEEGLTGTKAASLPAVREWVSGLWTVQQP